MIRDVLSAVFRRLSRFGCQGPIRASRPRSAGACPTAASTSAKPSPAATPLPVCIASRAHQERRTAKQASIYEGTHMRLAREMQAMREAGL